MIKQEINLGLIDNWDISGLFYGLYNKKMSDGEPRIYRATYSNVSINLYE